MYKLVFLQQKIMKKVNKYMMKYKSLGIFKSASEAREFKQQSQYKWCSSQLRKKNNGIEIFVKIQE